MNPKVLVVDDSDAVRRVVSRMVKTLGARATHEAADGLEAVQAVEGRTTPSMS